MFKELYGLATRFVARAPSRPSQKMKRPPETDDFTAQSDYFSSSRGDPVLDRSSYAEPNIHTMTSYVSILCIILALSPAFLITSICRCHSNQLTRTRTQPTTPQHGPPQMHIKFKQTKPHGITPQVRNTHSKNHPTKVHRSNWHLLLFLPSNRVSLNLIRRCRTMVCLSPIILIGICLICGCLRILRLIRGVRGV